MGNRGAFRILGAPLTLIFLITTSIYLVRSQSHPASDFLADTAGPDRIVEIATGASGSQIATQLAQSQIVQSSAAFFALLSKTNAREPSHPAAIASVRTCQHDRH